MIENAMKQMKEEEEKIKAAAELKETGGDEDADLFEYEKSPVNEEMYEDFEDFEEDLSRRNDEIFNELEEG
jgi:hypothetical protein